MQIKTEQSKLEIALAGLENVLRQHNLRTCFTYLIILCLSFFVPHSAKGNDLDNLLWFQATHNKANWAGSRSRVGNSRDFYSWLQDDADQKLPEFNSTLSLNCYEFVFYSALRSHKITKPWLKQFYANADKNEDTFRTSMLPLAKNTLKYTVTGVGGQHPKVAIAQGPRPALGDAILLDSWSHVVVATGNFPGGKIEVVSFAPLPIWGDGMSVWGVANVEPSVTTLEAIIENLVDLYPDVPTDWQKIRLEFGALPWSSIRP